MVTNLAGSQYVDVTVPTGVLTPRTKVADWFGHKIKVTEDGSETRIRMTMKEYDYAVLEWEP
jgi:hypothetical protein